MYSYFVTAFSRLKQLEKAEKQALLLEQSAKELSERQEREKQLQKLIEEKEVWSVKILSLTMNIITCTPICDCCFKWLYGLEVYIFYK